MLEDVVKHHATQSSGIAHSHMG